MHPEYRPYPGHPYLFLVKNGANALSQTLGFVRGGTVDYSQVLDIGGIFDKVNQLVHAFSPVASLADGHYLPVFQRQNRFHV